MISIITPGKLFMNINNISLNPFLEQFMFFSFRLSEMKLRPTWAEHCSWQVSRRVSGMRTLLLPINQVFHTVDIMDHLKLPASWK